MPVPVTANKRGAMPPKREARVGANDSTTSSDIDATNAIDAIGGMKRMLWATNCSAVTFATEPRGNARRWPTDFDEKVKADGTDGRRSSHTYVIYHFKNSLHLARSKFNLRNVLHLGLSVY